MIQNISTKLKDSICSSCGCQDRCFMHNIRYDSKYQRLCTSCVLFTCKEYYCPTCFGVHDLLTGEKFITCKRCNSKSHPICFPSNPSDSGALPVCYTCTEPIRLIFILKELKSKGVKGNYKIMDIKASTLLLTAAKIGCRVMSRAWEEKQDYASMLVTGAVEEHMKAKLGVIRAMRDHDLKNKDRHVESLIDFSDSEDDDSSETLSDNGRMQRSTIEGEDVEGERGRVPMEIDLNEVCI